jgi:excisionase family DNA binding protein
MTAPAHALDDRPFTVPSLAARWECSEGLIRKMIERGELHSFRIGALIRVPAAEVERIECQSLTASNDFAAGSPSSIPLEVEGNDGGSTPKIGRARKPKHAAYGKPATIHRGPWGGS